MKYASFTERRQRQVEGEKTRQIVQRKVDKIIDEISADDRYIERQRRLREIEAELTNRAFAALGDPVSAKK